MLNGCVSASDGVHSIVVRLEYRTMDILKKVHICEAHVGYLNHRIKVYYEKYFIVKIKKKYLKNKTLL